MKIVPCVLVVLCVCYGEMCDWWNVEIYVVYMCYWDCAPCVLVDEDMCHLNWEMNWSGWIASIHGSKLWNMMVMKLSWDDDQMMLWWNVNIGERSIILFIFAYQILMNLKMKATPKGRGLPHVKKIWGGDCRKKKKCIWRGLPQEKEKNGRGLPQEKKKRMAGTPARKRNVYGGDSRKKKKRMAGTPAREKRNVYGGDSRNWLMIWWGLPQ